MNSISFFVNVGPDLASKIITPPDENIKQYLTQPSNNFLRFNTVTENEVMNIINSLKSKLSFGHDKISTILIKKTKRFNL